jgi:hypothetical protein
VQLANPDAAGSAIDQNSEFAKLVHALPRQCHRDCPRCRGRSASRTSRVP